MQKRPFVIINPYQHEGDIAFGVWSDQHKAWVLGDGDICTIVDLKMCWKGSYNLLTWGELEAALKRSNSGNERRKQPLGRTK